MIRKPMRTRVVVMTALIAIILIAAIFASYSIFTDTNQDNTIVLPSDPVVPDNTPLQSQNVYPSEFLSVDRDNVQAVLDILSKPEHYKQNLTTETFWDGGSVVRRIEIWRSGKKFKAVISQDLQKTKHVLTLDDKLYIWYEGETGIFAGSVGEAFLAEDMAYIYDYEAIKNIDKEQISAVDYVALDEAGGIQCLYIENKASVEGYTERSWISLNTGLLIKSATLSQGQPVFWMLQESYQELPADDAGLLSNFRLPGQS